MNAMTCHAADLTMSSNISDAAAFIASSRPVPRRSSTQASALESVARRAVDRCILALYAQGRASEGFRLLAETYARSVTITAQRHLYRRGALQQRLHSVDDIAQDALLRAHDALCRERVPEEVRSLGAWLRQVVKFQVLDELGAQLRREGVELSCDPLPSSHPGDDEAWRSWNPLLLAATDHDMLETLMRREALEHYAHCTSRLKARQRDVLHLSMQGYKLREIAERLGLTISGVASARIRAMELVSEYFQKRGYQPALS